MNRISLVTATAIAVMCGTAFGADYLFPSATPPGGKKASEVKQYVSFIWDDNGYSGEPGSAYEPRALQGKETSIPYEVMGYVGGMGPDWQKDVDNYGIQLTKIDGEGKAYLNPLNIEEGDMGLSWAVKTLGAKLKGGHMSFNMISGLFIPSWGEDLPLEQYSSWKNRVSEYGSTKDNGSEHERIAISWGRENRISGAAITSTGDDRFTGNAGRAFMEIAMGKLIKAGHEVGNHTVDHMETNSIWPKKLWPNSGDGFDATGTADILGEAWDERAAGYSDSVGSRGWMKYAGKKLEKETWKGIIKLGEQDGPKNGIPNKLVGFRAPRLEINSNMFYALKDNSYLYDCGVEEGLEENRDGTNFLWPYTTDNGIPNFYTQTSGGEKLFVDSLPAGLWEIPVNVMIVPEAIRPAVFETYAAISEADNEKVGTFEDWDGKVTGFDFNLFILFGMTKDQALETMKFTFDKHYNGNRAPMQVGCHTDYFTPMYDFATLAASDVYKLALEKNTWKDRKEVWEEFVDHAASKPDVEFVTGKQLIDNIKAMIGTPTLPAKTMLSSEATWEFLADESGSKDNAYAANFAGAGFKGNITLAGGDAAYSSYGTDFTAGELTGLKNISLTYKSSSALAVRVYADGEEDGWEVILNNKGRSVESGAIPLSAFGRSQYSTAAATAVDASKIVRLEIAPLAMNEQCTFDISNIALYGAENYATPISGVASVANSAFKLGNMTAHSLNLTVPTTGSYAVQIFTANGRLVRSIDARKMNAGSNSVNMNTLPSGVYMVKISGEKTSFVAKALVM